MSPVQKLLVAGCCRHDVDKKTSKFAHSSLQAVFTITEIGL